MLVGQSVSLKVSSQQNVLVIDGHQVEPSWGSHVELLEGLKALSEVVPQVHSGEREITSKDEVLPCAHREGVHSHRTPRGESLDLHKPLPLPSEDLGVTDEAREAEVKNLPNPEVLHHLHIGQFCDLGVEGELLLASVPLVNHRQLRGAGEDEVWLSPNIQELYVGVSMPGMEGLMGVEAIAVPTINAGGACLGAVRHNEVPLSIQLEGLHKVGFPYAAGVDVLDLYKSLWVLFPPGVTESPSVWSKKLF